MIKSIGSTAFACGVWEWHTFHARALGEGLVDRVLGWRRAPAVGVGNGRLSGGLNAQGSR
jgi:hypothetical protein